MVWLRSSPVPVFLSTLGQLKQGTIVDAYVCRSSSIDQKWYGKQWITYICFL